MTCGKLHNLLLVLGNEDSLRIEALGMNSVQGHECPLSKNNKSY